MLKILLDGKLLDGQPFTKIDHPDHLNELKSLDPNLAPRLSVDPDDLADFYLNNLRQQRDKLLKTCDWTQMSDTALSDADKTAWASYRQALRDLPANTTDIENPIWPTKPL